MSDSASAPEDHFPSDDHSRPEGPSNGGGERSGPVSGHPGTASRRSFFDELLYRRIPQVLAGYLGVTWTLFELMKWSAEQYLISPHLARALLLALLLLLPAVLVVTYRHGRPGLDRWTVAEQWTIAGNVTAAALILAFVFGGVELGSMVRTVQTSAADTVGGKSVSVGSASVGSASVGSASVEDDEGGDTSEKVVRQVPKKEFRRRVALFYFDRMESARADTALLRAVPAALHADLEQDSFVSTYSPVGFADELRQRGYNEGLGVPLGLRREVAQKTGAEYMLAGSVGRTGDGRVRLRTRLRETKTGDLVAERHFESKDLFGTVDQASTKLKEDLGLPEGHLDTATDLPVTEVFTPSVSAAKRYAQGRYLQHFVDTTDQSVARKYRRATRSDTTFALGYQLEGRALWRLGKREQARRALEGARRHSYRLSESDKYQQKALRLYRLEGRPEAALEVCERWTSLHPYDLDGWRLKANLQWSFFRYEQALLSYRQILDLAPESRSAEISIARVLLRTGRPEKALQRATSYAESYPRDEEGPLLVGTIHWKLGQLGQAESAFRRARRMDAQDARPYLLALHQARGEFGQARSTIEEEAASGQASLRAEIHRSHHHWLRGRIGRSQESLDSLWAAEPETTAETQRYFLAMRACDHYRTSGENRPSGENPFATELIRRLGILRGETTQNTPGHKAGAQAALASCKTASGELTEAEKHLERATRLVERPDIPPTYRLSFNLDYLWGRLREAQDRPQDAAARYEKYIEDSSPRALLLRALRLPRLRLALSYQKAGRPGEAETTYRKALALHPAYPRLNYHYARFLNDRGRGEDARKHLRQALEGWAPSGPDFRLGQKAEALADSLGVGIT